MVMNYSTKEIFEKMIDDGSISGRKVGWFSVDIDEFPYMSDPELS